MVIAAATTELAVALVKALGKMWLKDCDLAEAGADSVLDTIKKHITDRQEQRAVNKLFTHIEDQVEGRLQKFIDAEFAGLPANEKAAATLAFARSLAEIKFDRALLDANLDASRLETALDLSSPRVFRDFAPSTAEFGRLLRREGCNYLVGIADKLPHFGLAATRAQLERLTEITDTLQRTLDELAAIRRQPSDDLSRKSASFEDQYRRTLVKNLDRIDMFGVRLTGAGTRDYDLTSAYVPLTVVPADGKALRVEEALAQYRLIVIRGEAGSGKTTLMQWLAVQGAKRAFIYPLENWNERLPFYLRLRDYRNELVGFPSPEAFLGGALRHVAGLMPNKEWVHEALARGALVLVDGVDEVPASRRKQWLEWLQGLTRMFENSVFAVSSRPAALDADQQVSLGKALKKQNFTSLTLEPMSIADSDALVRRWHAAVARDLKGEDFLRELETYERSLRQMLRERPAIRALASSPLLCAMICTLNWDRQRRLPDDRMELYRLALELLLDRREHERNIGGEALDRSTKETLLAGVAIWMLRNNMSEAERPRVENQVAILIRRMSHLADAAGETLQELLERSGILRAPQDGVIDFVHRTFLEYLGARAFVEEDDVDFLVQKAREENWREVIVFAAGHANGLVRDSLVRKLLGGRALWKRPMEADVAAVCCLETVGKNLDPELLAKLRAKAKELFPPTDQARIPQIAPAASFDPSLLFGYKGEEAAACIRTAAYVGTPPMLDVVESYAELMEPSVDEAIVQAMPAFDETAFEQRVLAKRATTRGLSLSTASEPDLARCIRILLRCDAALGGVQHSLLSRLVYFKESGALQLDLTRPFSKTKVDEVVAGERTVYFRPTRSLTSRELAGLESLSALKTVIIPHVTQDAFALLVQCKSLEELLVSTEDQLDGTGLANLTSLTSAALTGKIAGLEHLKHCHKLSSLLLAQNRSLSLDFLSAHRHLRTLAVLWSEVFDLQPLSWVSTLEHLRLEGTSSIDPARPELDLTPLKDLSKLHTLEVGDVFTNWSTPLALKDLPALTTLKLDTTEISGGGRIEGLESSPRLKELFVTAHRWASPNNMSALVLPETCELLALHLGTFGPPKSPGVLNMARSALRLASMPYLRLRTSVSLIGLDRLRHLRKFVVRQANIADIEVLVDLPNLREVYFHHCVGDFGQVQNILAERGVEFKRWPLAT